MSQSAHAEANIIFGATIDDALGDEVRVTVIAAGFDGGMPKRRSEGNVLRPNVPVQTQEQTRAEAQKLAGSRPRRLPPRRPRPSRRHPSSSGRPSRSSSTTTTSTCRTS